MRSLPSWPKVTNETVANGRLIYLYNHFGDRMIKDGRSQMSGKPVTPSELLGFTEWGSGPPLLLVLACTYAFNMATSREWLEGHLVPFLIRLLGMRQLANLVVSQSMLKINQERANWLATLIASQNPTLMLTAWKETMAFDSRRRLAEIQCPTLIIAGSNDQAVPIHHAKMLHEGIRGSQLTIIDGADHALIWTHTAEFMRVVDKFLMS